MKLDAVHEAIAFLRQHEEPLSVVTLMDDDQAKKLAAAWAMMPRPALRVPRARRPDLHGDPAVLYEWTWSAYPARYGWADPNLVDDLAGRAGLPPQACEAKLEKLVAARALYVDGTISDPLRRALNAYVVERLPRSLGRPPAPKKPEPEPKDPK